MAETKYTFSISEDFINNKVATDRLTEEIQDSDITIALSHIDTNDDICDIYFKDVLPSDDTSILVILISTHSGEPLPQTVTQVQVESYADGVTQNVNLASEFRDQGGKLRVHQTSRKDGFAIHWTGTGDDKSIPTNFGCGNTMAHRHYVGDSTSETIYVDFNVIHNESWIHEVVLTWATCDMDIVTVDIVPDICSIAPGTNTTFNIYGPILIPAEGDGTIEIISDVLEYGGGLVIRDSPSDPNILPGPAFWNADWNNDTGRFENLVAAPNGDGEYNIFHEERAVNRIFNRIILIQSGFQIFNSSDTDQITHGMRLRCTFNTTGLDHEWTVAAILVMHRQNVNVQTDGTL